MKFDSQKHYRRSIRLKGYDYSQAGAYFVTICAWQRECLFGEVVEGEVRLSAVGRMVTWEWRRLGQGFPNIELGAFVVMPNHVHGIIYIHDAERATRPVQSLIMNEDDQLPDMAAMEMGGSPVRGEGRNVGATQQGWIDAAATEVRWEYEGNVGNDGSPRREHEEARDKGGDPGDGDPDGTGRNVGATQQGWIDAAAAEVRWEYEGNVGNDGSPRREQEEARDKGGDPGDRDPDGPGRATRHEQRLTMDGDGELPDKAAIEMGGSPVQGAKGPAAQSLGAMVGQWKSRLTKRAWKLPGMQGRPIWQRNYYEHIIRDEGDLRRIEAYIQDNARRWEEDQLHPLAAPNKFNQDRST